MSDLSDNLRISVKMFLCHGFDQYISIVIYELCHESVFHSLVLPTKLNTDKMDQTTQQVIAQN